MYEEFFGLDDQPFRLSPDHRFFYLSSAHKRALAHLKFGLDQKEGFILITGEVGAGKTTLVEHLLSSLDARHFVAANIVTTNLDQENLIRMIASSFGLAQEGLNKTSVLKAVERFLADSLRQGRRCLLFVDEAQNLSIAALEELRMLSNLQVNGQPALQSFLIGQPQFRQTLARADLSQLRQRVIASYHLGPLNEEEVTGYIMHRLEVAGWSGDPDFDGGALQAIHQQSQGIPRRVNTLTNRLLLNAYLEEAHVITADDVAMVAEEIAEELGQVTGQVEDVEPGAAVDASAASEAPPPVSLSEERRKREADADLAERDVPIPHVSDAGLGPKPRAVENELADVESEPMKGGIPAFEEDEEEAEVIDLTIHADEANDELSLEAERKLKKRALHTVIDFLGGRGNS